jgi:hypothetical protein
MITIPNKYNISRDEWAAIRVQLVVLGCPSKAVPKRYTTFKHRLAVINNHNLFLSATLAYPRHLGWFAHWLNDNSLMVTHHSFPNRYHIGRWNP